MAVIPLDQKNRKRKLAFNIASAQLSNFASPLQGQQQAYSGIQQAIAADEMQAIQKQQQAEEAYQKYLEQYQELHKPQYFKGQYGGVTEYVPGGEPKTIVPPLPQFEELKSGETGTFDPATGEWTTISGAPEEPAKPPKIYGSPTVGYFYLDENNKAVTVVPAGKKGIQHFSLGDHEYSIDPETGDVAIIASKAPTGAKPKDITALRLKAEKELRGILLPKVSATFGGSKQTTAQDVLGDPEKVRNALINIVGKAKLIAGTYPDIDAIEEGNRLAKSILNISGKELQAIYDKYKAQGYYNNYKE